MKDKALQLADLIDSDFDPDWMAEEGYDQIAAELRRLHRYEQAYNEWSEKTEWVQETVQPRELGMHRADALKQRVEHLHKVNADLLEALKALVAQEFAA